MVTCPAPLILYNFLVIYTSHIPKYYKPLLYNYKVIKLYAYNFWLYVQHKATFETFPNFSSYQVKNQFKIFKIYT